MLGSEKQNTVQDRIYLADIRPLNDERLFNVLFEAASEQRREKIVRLRRHEDRLRSLGVEALLLYALKEAGVFATAPVYAYGKNGKPCLQEADGFFFNASHDGDYVMIVVSDAEVGCDIERIEPVNPRLAAHVLTPTEHAAYEACDPPERDALFFRYWVAKESCMKALGEGLAADPASFEIEFGRAIRVKRNGVYTPLALCEGEFPGYRYAACREGRMPDARARIIHLESIAGGINL